MSLIKSIVKNGYDFGFLGMGLMVVMLGSLFSIELVRYGYIILGIAVIASIYFLDYWLKAHSCGSVSAKHANYIGTIGTLILLLYFGIQSPQIPLKEPLIVLGAVLTAPFLLKNLGVIKK